MSKVIKYYYSRPIYKATIANNPILKKTVVSKLHQGNRYTIAAVYDDEDHTIKFGLAICRPEDNFCKKIGRQIAEHNAAEAPFHVILEFTGRRNDYADDVMKIIKEKELKLTKQHNPNLFNPEYFVE